MRGGPSILLAPVVAAGAAALLAGCGRHAVTPRRGVLYLVTTRDLATAVYRVNPDGSGLQRLPKVRPQRAGLDVDSSSFSVAPSGTSIAFVSDERAYFANPDGSGIRPEAPRFGAPSTWSPDGRFIASASLVGDETIDIAGADGKSRSSIAIGGEGEPAWSPKGDVLAVSEDEATGAPGPPGIYTVTSDGREQKLLFAARRFHGDVPLTMSWSPNGRRIAFAGYVSETAERLYVGDVASGKVWRLTRHIEKNVSLAWSPDGSRLAFASARGDGPSEVYVVRVGGTGEHVVSHSTGGESSGAPQWAPDGVRLAYVRNRVAGQDGVDGDVYIVRADGTGVRPLLPRGVDVGEVNGVVWTSLPPLAGARPRPAARARAVQPLFTLQTTGVGEIAPNGPSVAVEEATPDVPRGQDNCGRILVWTPRAHRVVRAGPECEIGEALDSLLLLGDAAAWNFSEWDRYPIADCLLLWRPLVESTPEPTPYGDCAEWSKAWFQRERISSVPRPRAELTQIVASGSTLLYNAVRVSCYDDAVFVRSIEADDARPTGLASGTPIRLCRGGQGPEARAAHLFRLAGARLVPVPTAVHLLVLDAFDGSLVAGREDEHHVVVFRLGGDVLARRSFTDPVGAVRLGGSQLAVQAGGSLTVVDIRTGHSRRFALSSAAGTAVVQSFDGRIAAYATGPEIHLLRVADGRDRMLRTEPAVGPVDAQLEPSGLFYSYNLVHARKPGRVSFVPRARLAQLFAPSG